MNDEKEFNDILSFKKNDTVCIMGFAPSWIQAPLDKYETVDIWGINELYLSVAEKQIETKFHMWFEVHNIKHSPSKQRKQHQEFLKNCKIPLITQQHWDEYPSSIPYPREYVKKFFNKPFIVENGGAGFSDYSNQISWMIALAICMGYKTIMVHGVDMAQDSEYAFQKPSCQFFLGYAGGAGHKLLVPATSQLLKCGSDYGFESDNKNRFSTKDKIKETTSRQNKIALRNLELEHLVDDLKKEMEYEDKFFEADYKGIDDRLVNLNYSISANESILKFMNEMPDNIEAVINGKNKFLKSIPAENKKLEREIKKLKKELAKIKNQYTIKKIRLSVQIKAFNLEKEKNAKDIDVLSGIINNCHHMLNRNLV